MPTNRIQEILEHWTNTAWETIPCRGQPAVREEVQEEVEDHHLLVHRRALVVVVVVIVINSVPSGTNIHYMLGIPFLLKSLDNKSF